ncbi:fluoride efflux transporter FluC [Helicobacter trogontum]|uniref:Fluoride-specific ion channel FluC n=1 Tax=Helicobacter trogontum TaxID=50960 RepID=A0A4U8SBB1_9HELI|nr:CrcB family protein [Helicobacter trogontum]TLD83329.1 CrcB family protein [Helicobacter trogontum]
MLIKLILVGLGGSIGAILRFSLGYGFSLILPSQYLHYSFIATFCINMLACFCIGICVATIKEHDSLLLVFLTIGVLGGFSTFSTFSLEVLKLLQTHFFLTAFLYVLLSNICGILCVYMGYSLKG